MLNVNEKVKCFFSRNYMSSDDPYMIPPHHHEVDRTDNGPHMPRISRQLHEHTHIHAMHE